MIIIVIIIMIIARTIIMTIIMTVIMIIVMATIAIISCGQPISFARVGPGWTGGRSGRRWPGGPGHPPGHPP